MSTREFHRRLEAAALHATRDAAHAGATIAARMPILTGAFLAPTPEALEEWHLAWTEKVIAATAGGFAAIGIASTAWMRAGLTPPTPMGIALTMLQVSDAAMRPARRKVAANAARFREAKRSGRA